MVYPHSGIQCNFKKGWRRSLWTNKDISNIYCKREKAKCRRVSIACYSSCKKKEK